MNFTSFRRSALALTLALCAAPVAAAPEADAEATRAATVKLINLLVEQGVLTHEKAEALLGELNRPTAPAAQAPAPVRVPYMPEFMRKELKDEIQLDLAAQAAREGWAKPGSVPAWVRGLSWEGDVRTRLQLDDFDAANGPQISVNETNRARSYTELNTKEDRTRLRVRARLGVTGQADDNWSAGVRLTTGSTSDPISSNQTLGNYNNRFTTAFDRAYIRYRHGGNFNAVAGRFGNPWAGTDLVWANDLGFDGLALQWTPALSARAQGFLTVAAMPVQEVEMTRADKWLYGVQAGAVLPSSAQGLGARLSLGYYRYENIEGEVSPPSKSTNEYTAPQFAQKGNTYYNISSDGSKPLLGLASKYHLVNLTGQVDFPVGDGKRLVVTGDYVRNIGFDSAVASARAGADVSAQTTGYQLRLAYGAPEVKKLHDWQASMAYKRLERDAVLDAFTDGDFRLGGTDARGYILGFTYGVGKNTAASLRYFSGDSISGPPLSVDVIQLELNLHF